MRNRRVCAAEKTTPFSAGRRKCLWASGGKKSGWQLSRVDASSRSGSTNTTCPFGGDVLGCYYGWEFTKNGLQIIVK